MLGISVLPDTWDCDFLESLFNIIRKIIEHLENRQNLKVSDGVNLDTVYLTLTYGSLSRSGGLLKI